MIALAKDNKPRKKTYVYAQDPKTGRSKSVTIDNASPVEVISLLKAAVAAKAKEESAQPPEPAPV